MEALQDGSCSDMHILLEQLHMFEKQSLFHRHNLRELFKGMGNLGMKFPSTDRSTRRPGSSSPISEFSSAGWIRNFVGKVTSYANRANISLIIKLSSVLAISISNESLLKLTVYILDQRQVS